MTEWRPNMAQQMKMVVSGVRGKPLQEESEGENMKCNASGAKDGEWAERCGGGMV